MTDALVKLNPLLPYWLLTIVFVITVSMLVWFEVKKVNRFRNLRMACALILALTVLGVTLQPTIRRQKSDFTILLTDNADLKALDSLKKEFPGGKILSVETSQSNRSSSSVSSVNDIPIDEVKLVLGNGLDAAAQDVFESKSFAFIPSSFPYGIIGLTLPQRSRVYSQNTIHGVYNNNVDSVKIVLEGPGGKEDSILVSKRGMTNFNLSFTPRQQGNFNYLLSINGKSESVPVTVESEKQMKILFIQMFPTFETGYLKNVLAANHQLVFRYQLSKNNFRYEYINHPPIRTDRLTSEILHGFDLVIIDTDALNLLLPSEQKTLSAGVSAGLGVLVLFNENPSTYRLRQSILSISFNSFPKDTAQFALTKKLNLPAWPVQVVNDGKIIPTVKNKERILAGYMYQGFGKIGFQLLQETYKLTLEGDSASYKNLWTSVLQKNARTHSENFQIKIENEFPVYANEPVTVQVIGSAVSTPILIHNGIEVPLAEDVLIDDLWKTKVWPGKSGWQQLRIKGDSSKHSYYVSGKGEWKSLAAANSIRNTKAMASSEKLTSTSSWEYKPLAPWFFYLMFLLACATLWLTPKI